eukprot:CAMPEP_0179036174 /NCGR_PEP_ID=MMETSP0796-20121207/13481_1 /TAXON_ID=73915 /ORGANISM="Pyrodinium bahamense, Strain pbaha01" /LENGTH=762 /DNA_ID=CAMNT_0020732451 /DNA_START=78 /DNA_END=2366 /DNA_ORIENTATION=+
MKVHVYQVVLVLVAAWGHSSASAVTAMTAGDTRTITQVVKLLEDMLAKSKQDGDTDREIYAKLKCYCDTNEQAKTEQIDSLSKQISEFESKIEELQGSSAKLSSECAKLKEDMAANELARTTAANQREEEAERYEALRLDLSESITQMNKSIDVLAEIGADQSLENAVAADHTKFMAGYPSTSLLKLQARVKEALSAASAFLADKQKFAVESFVQKPFTGTYTAQSGEVIGILKNMRDTFKSNLDSATALENKQIQAYKSFGASMLDKHTKMSEMYDDKQTSLGDNDGELAAKKTQLTDAISEKEVREDFLSEMRPMCGKKAKEYQERNMLRASEDAAITEAIAILNRDSSFELFGKVAATREGSTGLALVQLLEVHPHASEPAPTRLAARRLLDEAAAGSGRSPRLARAAALLEAGNPFDVVLLEIAKMIETIEEEAMIDRQELQWCNAERERSNGIITDTDEQILLLEGEIGDLNVDIEAPEVGLKAQIQSTEQGLQQNYQSQKSQTEMRTKENLAYQAEVDNLVKTKALLLSAMKVLTIYYQQIGGYAREEEEPVPVLPGETEARPSTWEKEKGYKGQSEKGTSVIDMLTFIHDEVAKEEALAHTTEQSAQHAFEDSMAELKSGEASMQKNLADLRRTLADKEQELLEKQDDLRVTSATNAAAKAYLLKIKPGCDFITENIDHRDGRRQVETAALKKAAQLLKGTPAYKAAVAAADLESLGPCRSVCEEEGREHVKCQACLAKVSIPGYCAGHPDTLGC